MAIFATAGAKLYVGGPLNGPVVTPTSFTTPPQTWVEIKGLENLGSLGDTSEEITFDEIGVNRRQKLKGVRDAGTMEVTAGIDSDDPGQAAVLAADATPHDYAFRLVFNDAPPGGTPSERRFVAKVMSVSEQFDTANNVMKLSMRLGVNSNVVRIAAEEA